MPSAAGNTSTLLIVGNGMVSHSLCEKLVHKDLHKEKEIIVIGDEPRPAYDRVHLTDYFKHNSPEALELAPRQWYVEHGIRLESGVRVTSIDRHERLVKTSSGESIRYAELVLATGSRPFVPSIPGTSLPGVFCYRTLEDLDSMREYAAKNTSAAVMGGGLLGLEAAKALHDLGLKTHVIEMAPGLMPRQLDSEGGAVLQKKIEQLGVSVHLVKRTNCIGAIGKDRVLQFDQGAPLRVGMVVISAGIRPRDELARDCGLEIGERGGIVVSDTLQTSDPNVWAIGECARHDDQVYGLVGPGYQMASVLADNLAGENSEFKKGDLSARLKLLGVDVATLGEPIGESPNATTTSWTDGESFRKLILQGGRVVGAMSVGTWVEIDRVQQLIAAGQRLWPWNFSRFEANGRLWRSGSCTHIHDWPDNAIVCSCKQVQCSTLREARALGATSIESLVADTGASTVCGSCEPLLCELLGAPSETKNRNAAGLFVASVLAIVIGLFWLAGPIPFSISVTDVWHRVDYMWRDGFWKQTTGYSLLGAATVGLLLPLRKRLSWLTFGDYRFWRTAHSVIGLLSLAGLFAHTGMRLGRNLNFLLATTFLGLIVIGGLTGAITAMESRVQGGKAIALRRWRPRIARCHILLFLPLPVLLFMHIARVYYY